MPNSATLFLSKGSIVVTLTTNFIGIWLKVNSKDNNNISFKAKWVKTKKYKSACEGAYLVYLEHKIPEGEKLLSTFPDHKLKLENNGIRNLTTKKYHKFPSIDDENTHFENLMYFYNMLKEQGNKFIQELFK